MTPETLYIEIRIVYTETEQEFLRLAVQAASKKYRDISLEKASVKRNGSAIDCGT